MGGAKRGCRDDGHASFRWPPNSMQYTPYCTYILRTGMVKWDWTSSCGCILPSEAAALLCLLDAASRWLEHASRSGNGAASSRAI